MKIDVPANQFERTLKRFLRKVRTSGIAGEVAAREAYRSPSEVRRISKRRAIKRQIKADAERAELDAASVAPSTTYLGRQHDRLVYAKSRTSKGRR